MAWNRTIRGWASACAVVVLAGSLVGACAQGAVDTGDDDDGGSGASGPTSGNGGAGVGGAGGTSGMSSSDASSSSTGTPCDEQPCKLVAPQCGCALDEKCTIDLMGMRVCEEDGTVPIGEACNNNCAAGGQCLNAAGLTMCYEYCATDAECDAPGGLCAVGINNGMGGTWPDKFCSVNCDPVSGTGCNVAGAKCELGQEQDGQMRFFTQCLGSGAGTQSAACTDTGDCAPGYGCFMVTSLTCLRYCMPANPNCPIGTACSSFSPPISIGSIEYGACL